MQAIRVIGQGQEARLELGEAPDPKPAAREILIRVAATAVNRADLMQRRGLYPPPPGASEILGLECAGVVEEIGSDVRDLCRGDRVMALLPGGGYGELAVVDAGSAMRVPEGLDLETAAGIPEVFLTCSLNLFDIAATPAGGAALVHGGGSGIGTAAIQLLRLAGVRSIVTAGSDEKCARCRELGADLAINYRNGPFAAQVLEATDGRGVDTALDSIGASYLAQHLECLAPGGSLVLIGLMGGARAEVNLALLLTKRLSVIGSTLRARPPAEKAQIVRRFLERFGAFLEGGQLRAVVDRVLPLAEAQRAHDIVERSEHCGQVVLRV